MLADRGGPFGKRTRSEDTAAPRSSRRASLRPWAPRAPATGERALLYCTQGDHFSGWGQMERPLGRETSPVVWVAFYQWHLLQLVRTGHLPLNSARMVSQVGGFVSAANPTSSVQEWLSHWPGERWPSPPGNAAEYLKSILWMLNTVGMRESSKKKNKPQNKEQWNWNAMCRTWWWAHSRHSIHMFNYMENRSLRKNTKQKTTKAPASLL